MDEVTADALRWQMVSQRVTLLEESNRGFRRRLLLTVGLNAVLLVSVFAWLVWPREALAVKALTAARVDAASFRTGGNEMRPDGLVLVDDAHHARITLGDLEPGRSGLRLESEGRGKIVAGLTDAPSLGIYGGGSAGNPPPEPQIELSVSPDDGSPHIVMRDVTGRVVWQAP